MNGKSDLGSASLTIVLLAPLLFVLMFIAFQAAMWNHAQTEARVIARETAVLVARDGMPVGQAQLSAWTALANDSVLTHVDVSIETTAINVIVTITGSAPGLLRGTSSGVKVTAAVSLEGWVPL